ncbi:MAG: hypothetical protein IPL26_21765 [Leptospiraceae bacterium]|nr:hypothetical protein [Leptospiraceae bacterium]
MEYLKKEFSRNTFLKLTVKAFAITALSIEGVNCGKTLVTPALKGISQEEYFNMQCLAEIFLKDNPVSDFDLGKALDDYIYGHPSPIPTKDIIHELAGAPSSILASLILDFSFTPLVKLNLEDREKRLLSWKNSDSKMKRGLFGVLRQTSMFLLSSNKEYQKYIGYEG